MLNKSKFQSDSYSIDEIKLGDLRKQLEAGFLISSYFREIKDDINYITFSLHSNESIESLISIPDSDMVQEFLQSKEFDRHKRILKEKAAFIIDLVEFSHLSADDQLNLLVRYQTELNYALENFDIEHKISIGDGTIIVLEAASIPQLIQCIYAVQQQFEGYNRDFGHTANNIKCRYGVNIGTCFDFRDINSHWNVLGPGINDTQRLMSFARGYQTIVSSTVKQGFEEKEILSPEGVKVTFGPEKKGLDKHKREHTFHELKFSIIEKPFSVRWQF
ncbi:MAG: hypothetical protein IIB40_07400 [Candidatus Marinimicrobia bacterium]|nr:hypothetical protein [Candidatus Neomarinimicrobiota bacterium]